jgi:hypothetical protein
MARNAERPAAGETAIGPQKQERFGWRLNQSNRKSNTKYQLGGAS